MGFFAVGIYHTKSECNIGTLWRSANLLGASMIFTVGRRYSTQASDTMKTHRHIPLLHFADIDDLVSHLPVAARLVGIEFNNLSAEPLPEYAHPKSVCYLLGAEDHGLSGEVLKRCHEVVYVPFCRYSLNVAVAGSIVMYDRASKEYARREALTECSP